MRANSGWIASVSLVWLAFAAGCPRPTEPSSANEEKAVHEVVTAFQAALKARDADRLWSLLASDSRADAERAAKAVRELYAKASALEKAEQEKEMGLSGAELASLTGAGFLKTRRFHGKYDEVPDSKIDEVAVQGDTAKVSYTEPDGDKEKLTLVREKDGWKVAVPMPKVTQP